MRRASFASLRLLPRLVIALMAAVLPASAAALALLPVSDGRLVEIELEGGGGGEFAAPSPDFANFDALLAFVGAGDAHQSSRIGALQFTGSGGDFTDGAGATAGRSRFDLVFRVDADASFALSGGLDGDLTGFQLSLARTAGGALFAPVLAGQGPLAFDATGLLEAGIDHRLIVESSHGFGGGGVGPNQWNFAFSVAAPPVPEPRAGVLFAVGTLLGAHGAGRRRRSDRKPSDQEVGNSSVRRR